MNLTNEIAVFAARFHIAPSVAYVLPALFEKCAEETGLPVRALVSRATYSNQELGDYIAGIARTVAKAHTITER